MNTSDPVDNWEDKADMSVSATTPDDEENSMEDESGIKKSFHVKQKPKTDCSSLLTSLSLHK